MRQRWQSGLEAVLWVGASCLLGAAGYHFATYELFQHCPDCFAATPSTGAETSDSLHSSNVASATAQTARVLGHLQIPRLGMNVAVLNGDDEGTLSLGAGHVPGTAAPGSSGNSVIAGHRDMVFRKLRNIRLGDRVRFSDRQTYEYVVSKIFVVNPDDVSVLRNEKSSTLTMITCYPFRFIGSAPQRFIVQATLVRNGLGTPGREAHYFSAASTTQRPTAGLSRQ